MIFLNLSLSKTYGYKNFILIQTKRYFQRFSTNFDIGTNSFLADLKGSRISDYWIKQLEKLERASAIELIPQLINTNEIGFPPNKNDKKTTLLGFVLEQKRAHPDKVILMRNGEFYETWGVDALLLINYCGLNPMGGKAKAGCPVKNIQATLDGLTDIGLSAAVYEEATDNDADRGPSSSRANKMKQRFLSQIISPGSRTYAYDLCLRSENLDYRENQPVLGIMNTASGYTVCHVWLDEKKMIISEQLTAEAVRILYDQFGCIEPVYADSKISSELLFLPACVTLSGYHKNQFPDQVLRRMATDFEVDINDFRIQSSTFKNRPRSIYSNTALQIGLLSNSNVPNLIPFLLPESYSAHSARFLRHWLLHPPPIDIADEMQSLCQELCQLKIGLPSCNPIPVGKIISLLRAKQCNVVLFRDIYTNVKSVYTMLDIISNDDSHPYQNIVNHLLPILGFITGLPMNKDQLKDGCKDVLFRIQNIIVENSNEDLPSTDPKGFIPNEFFRRNELEFRGKVSMKLPEMIELHSRLNEATNYLLETVYNHFPDKNDIVHDILGNLIMIRDKPSVSLSSSDIEYIQVKNLKKSARRYTTRIVESALNEYLSVVEDAPIIVTKILQKLSESLVQKLDIIVLCAHWAIVQTAIYAHSKSAIQKGWTLPKLIDNLSYEETKDSKIELRGLIPYWINRYSATPNDIDLSGIFLLTAPNMSGKSTIMRSSLVAALLGNCGLFIPASSAIISRFNNFFLRTASYDVPSEGKSAFALEMDDVRVVLRDSTSQSLVMIDELGKGTSARDGSALAGALLEQLDKLGCTGIFATHLHEVFQLPLSLCRVSYKRMGVVQNQEGGSKSMWTYKLEDGKCTNSMALETAKEYGISSNIITRAAELAKIFDLTCRNPNLHSESSSVAAEVRMNLDNNLEKLKNRSISDVQELSKEGSNPTILEQMKLNELKDAKRLYSLETDVVPILNEYTSSSVGVDKTIIVEPGYNPPLVLEGKSCVYVLHIQKKPDEIYVGETESISQRLVQHWMQYKGISVRAAVINVPNKSSARALESLLIKKFKELGYAINRDTDQQHILFGAPPPVKLNKT